jgi:hypothetical protein
MSAGNDVAPVGARPPAAATARTISKALSRDTADPASPLAGLGALPWQYWIVIALAVALIAALTLRTRSRRTTHTE